MVGSVPTPVVHTPREISGFEVRLVHLLFSERDQSLKSEKMFSSFCCLLHHAAAAGVWYSVYKPKFSNAIITSIEETSAMIFTLILELFWHTIAWKKLC
jgi:hypothetical protein